MGPHYWDTPTNVCGDDKSERKLFLTSCNETEFSCLDGVCIPIHERYRGGRMKTLDNKIFNFVVKKFDRHNHLFTYSMMIKTVQNKREPIDSNEL